MITTSTITWRLKRLKPVPSIYAESSAKNWATRYIGKNFAKGYIVKDEHKNESAQDTRWLAFNIQRPVFNDRRVREAISLAFDFEWMNKALFYGPTAAPTAISRIPNMPRAITRSRRAGLLAPLKAELPPEVFTTVFQPPASNGDGYDRDNLLKPASCWMTRAGT
jgi:microcin C transport system substrate-binding protein